MKMRKAILRLSFKFLLLGILTGGLWYFYNADGFSQTAPLRVVVAQQSDSPILVVSTYVDSSDPLRPEYGYTVTNTSDKPIRAYTIRESASSGGGGPVVGTTITHFPGVRLFLKPHESRQDEGGAGRVYESPRTGSSWRLILLNSRTVQDGATIKANQGKCLTAIGRAVRPRPRGIVRF
jgi:hypothetical protein